MWMTNRAKNKFSLIRSLLERRVTTSPEAIKAGFAASDVQEMGRVQLMSSPEASIVCMAERVYELSTVRRLDDQTCIGIVNNERRLAGASASVPPGDLISFFEWRVLIEHPTVRLSRSHVIMCAHAGEDLARRSGRRLPEHEDAFMYGHMRSINYELRQISEVVGRYYDGEISEEEFHASLAKATEAAMQRRTAAALTSRQRAVSDYR